MDSESPLSDIPSDLMDTYETQGDGDKLSSPLVSEAQMSQDSPANVTRKDIDLNRKDKSLAEFLLMMEDYTPIIPDAVMDYYLSKTGFECDDVRIKRLLALAAQKFVADIATDAYQFCKIRQQGSKRGVSAASSSAGGSGSKTVLTMDDLSAALAEYGVNVRKPDYFT
ncbi:hypothetical protein BZG36_01424 [Bifiguratus adelaidae]|uniref:Transcription initiation factor TFIID subunit 10 n=1 Tax=Bifiguratus adelaidae TaxID=1938954 RepID=A0A261Y519_9FUNG|nr:hypothetical protein BZG36_01424 [Bifiguratus adelaidae]